MAEDTRRRSTVNVARLTMWKMTGDTSAATTYEETPYTWENSLAAVKYTPKMQTNEQYGGSVTGRTAGSLVHPFRFAVLDCEIAKISLTRYAGVSLFALIFTRATRSDRVQRHAASEKPTKTAPKFRGRTILYRQSRRRITPSAPTVKSIFISSRKQSLCPKARTASSRKARTFPTARRTLRALIPR